MKVAFVYDGYGAQGWPVHGPFDALHLCDAPHGLSGTEIPMFGMARELARMGHDVAVFSRFMSERVEDVGIVHGEERRRAYVTFADMGSEKGACDIAIAFHDGRPLDHWPAKKKVLHVQGFLLPNRSQTATYDNADFADIYITATEHIARHLERAYGWPKVHVVPNAWDFGTYHPWQPVPGRLIYTTSLERGFHRLLEAFPLIREQCPEAHIVAFERGGPMVEKLKANPVPYVTLMPAASLNDVLRELSYAACFAYPADCSSPTEVFPVSVLQACATGVPVVCAPDDSFELAFGDSCWWQPEVKRNPNTWRTTFAASVISVLKSEKVAREVWERGKRWSAPLTHAASARRLAEIVGLAT